MNIRQTLLKNSGAAILAKLSMVLYRILSVPLLLYYIGVQRYGAWLVISSLPTWLTMANVGIGTVAGNGMSMETAKGNHGTASKIYSSTLAMLVTIFVTGTLLLYLAIHFIPITDWLQLDAFSVQDVSQSIFILGVSTLLAFFNQAFSAKFRAARKAYISILLNSLLPWMQLGGLWIALQMGGTFTQMATSALSSSLLFSVVNMLYSRKALPLVNFSFNSIQKETILSLASKGFAFQAFPLGNALIFQGNLLVINASLGASSVATFGTARTLTRSVNQLLEMINQSVWPELSHLLGAGNLAKAARLHRLSVGVALLAGLGGATLLGFIGPWIYSHWTSNQIHLPQHLLILFLVPLPFCTLWYTSSVVHAACNKHEGLAWRYLMGSGLSVLLCYVLCQYFGLEGAAIATALLDIILFPYVLTQSIRLTGDTFPAFIKGVPLEIRGLINNVVNVVRKVK